MRPPAAPLSFSVIINTYNRVASLARTLEAVRRLRWRHFEVVVVDGPSTDGTGPWLDAHAPDVKRGQVPEAHLCVSRNAGLRLAAGDVVVYLDDDAVPEPSWLAALAPAFADPTVDAAGGFVRDPTGVTFQARHIAYDRFANGQMDRPDGPAPWHPGAHTFQGLLGANCAFRAATLRALGGFDETYAFYLDETDVLLRLMDAGGRLAVRPLAEVHHHYAPSHLRDARRTPRPGAWRTILRSITYFIVQANRGLRTGAEVDAAIAHKVAAFTQDATTLRAEGRLDDAGHAALLAEIAQGVAEGRAAAASAASRRLGRDLGPPPGPLTPLCVPPAPAARLRLAVVLPAPGPARTGLDAVAVALAQSGHEVTTLALASDGRPGVARADGCWRHQLSARRAGVALDPASAPRDPRAAAWAASVHAELLRTAPTRGYQAVLAAPGEPGVSSLVASGRWTLLRVAAEPRDADRVAAALAARLRDGVASKNLAESWG